MANPTITRTVSGNVHTFTFQAGDVDSVNSEISSNLETTEMPLSPPADSILFDVDGSMKTITLSGTLHSAASSVVTGTGAPTVTSILDIKRWLEASIDGAQSSVTFTSTYESVSMGSGDGNLANSTTTVMYSRLSFIEEVANPTELKFSLRLVVGSG